MGELVNLRRARKRREKEESSKAADMNRARFGRTKSERESVSTQAKRAARALDQHRLPKGDEI